MSLTKNNTLGYLKNANWENRWKDIVATDQDFDCDYLIRLITHKLKLMIEYFGSDDKDNYTSEVDVDIILKELTDCYVLGERILTYNYGELVDDLFSKCNIDSAMWFFKEENRAIASRLEELSDKATSDRAKDIKNFFGMLGKYASSWWG